MRNEAPRQVRKRRVFYIPGYDPIHPRRYRELYRTEAARQAKISGHEITLAPKSVGGRYGWHVSARIEGEAVETDIEVLVWSDIVRESMEAGIAATYVQMARTAWTYIATGTLFRLMRLRKGPVIAALYPVFMLICQAVLSLLIGAAVFWGVTAAGGALAGLLAGEKLVTALSAACMALGGVCGITAAYAMLRWFKKRDGVFFAHYLMHDYAFSARWNGANPEALERRMAEFGDAIEAALTSDTDEVLIVGHSSGAHLAVSILADLIRAGRVPDDGPILSFLSLGQVVPMMSFLPAAHRLRADLNYLSNREELAWVDVTAPGDGCAFALCDPVAVSGVAPEDQKWPLILSAAFTQTLAPETWKALRWRFFRLHFQYLCAFDRPRDYDYFRITAGPQTLGARYAGRMPSKSRITAAASRYTSMTA